MRYKSRNRALAMIVILLALGLLSVIAVAVISLTTSGLQNARLAEEGEIALYAAEAGLNLKLQDLKNGDKTDRVGSLETVDANFLAKVYESGETPPGTSLTIPAGEFYFVDSTGTTQDGRRSRVGMLVRKSSSAFNVAVLAKDQIQMKEGSYTDTYDSSDPFVTFDHSLASVGISSPSGKVQFDSDALVGKDGSLGTANVVGPAGADESLMVDGGVAGTNYNNFVTTGLLSHPEPIVPRSHGDTDAKTTESPGGEIRLTPVWNGTEYVIARKAVEIEAGGRVILDISAVPDGEIAHFDFEKVVMKGGELILETGGSNANCAFYVKSSVTIEGGSIINPTQRPERFQFILEDKVEMKLDTAAYFVAIAKQFQLEGSEIYGSVVALEQIQLDKGSVIHYDQSLADSIQSGISTLIQLSYQKF